MKQLLGGVAIGAVLAIAAPVWAQQNPNNPSTAAPSPGATAPVPQNQNGAPPIPQAPQPQHMAPQAQAPAHEAPQNPNGTMPEHNAQGRMQEQNAEHRTHQNGEHAAGGREEGRMMARHHHHFAGRYYGRGLAYRMAEPGRHWRYTHAWRMHHHLGYAQGWRFHHRHWRYAREWGYQPYAGQYWGRGWRYSWRWHHHWPSDWMAERLNAQELGTLGGMPRAPRYYGYSGASTAPMAYTPSAGYGAMPPGPAPMGYGDGSVLWYPPHSNPPSPPGFPPAFYGTWGW